MPLSYNPVSSADSTNFVRGVYGIYDNRAGLFIHHFLSESDAQATRSFILTFENPLYSNFPMNFDLYFLAAIVDVSYKSDLGSEYSDRIHAGVVLPSNYEKELLMRGTSEELGFTLPTVMMRGGDALTECLKLRSDYEGLRNAAGLVSRDNSFES